MPLDSKVTTKDTGGGVQAEGEVQDIIGPGGGKSYDTEVIMVIDPTHVKWSGYVSPQPYKKKTSGTGDIRFWWKANFKPEQKKMFKVGLKCKKGANGPTPIAITACSDANKKSKPVFSASIDILYHSPHACQKAYTLKPIPWPKRPKLRKPTDLRKRRKR